MENIGYDHIHVCTHVHTAAANESTQTHSAQSKERFTKTCMHIAHLFKSQVTAFCAVIVQHHIAIRLIRLIVQQ